VGIEDFDQGLALAPVVFGLLLVAADNIGFAGKDMLLDQQLRLRFALAFEHQRHEGSLIIEHQGAGGSAGSLARAQNIGELACFQGRDGLSADHAAIGDDTDLVDTKTLPEPIDHRQERGDIGGVTRHHLGAERPAGAVHDECQNHLVEIGTIILRKAALAQSFVSLCT
jgi:hypothetical protein